MAASVAPTTIDPWSNLAFEKPYTDLYDYSYKFDNWADQTYPYTFVYTHEGNTITITSEDGYCFDWTATKPVGAVIVKAGTKAYLYEYEPQVLSDTNLCAPDGKEVSHVTFAWNIEIEYCYETAYAKGSDAINFIPTFNNWGWTIPIEGYGTYEFDLWAGAAQCNTDKGILVGTVEVTYSEGSLDVEFHMGSGYILKNALGEEETQVYAGSTMFPTFTVKGVQKSTVAPGQYYIDTSVLDGGSIYVIIHAVVGIPC